MVSFTIVPPDSHLKAKIKIVGVGGGGCNALDSMIEKGLKWVDFIAVNTDSQNLKTSKAYVKLQVGNRSTQGLGAGGDPTVGEEAATEDKARIAEALDGADMVFIAASLGGGTGTGASPVVSKVSKEVGALTVAIVTIPFSFEGETRNQLAMEGLKKLEREVDTLIVIPNDKLHSDENSVSLKKGFDCATDVLYRAVSGITDIINTPGHINMDFADVRSIMRQEGSKAIMGTGIAEGADRAVKAAEIAVESPLLGSLSIEGAKGVLLHVTAPSDFGIDELKKVCDYVMQKANEKLNLIVGLVLDSDIGKEVKVTIVATGIRDDSVVPSVKAPPLVAVATVQGSDDGGFGNNINATTAEAKEDRDDPFDKPAYTRKVISTFWNKKSK